MTIAAGIGDAILSGAETLSSAGIIGLVKVAAAYGVNRLTSKADRRDDELNRDAEELTRGLRNADVHRLMGRAISLALRVEAKENPNPVEPSAKQLIALASAVEKHWMSLEEVELPEALQESNVSVYFTGAPEEIKAELVPNVADADRRLAIWCDTLQPIADSAQLALSGEAWRFIATMLSQRYVRALYAATKTAAVNDDPAWPGLLLRLLAEQRGLVEHLVKESGDSKETIGEIKALLGQFSQAGVARLEQLIRAADQAAHRRYQSLYDVLRNESQRIRDGLVHLWKMLDVSAAKQAHMLASLTSIESRLDAIAADAATAAKESRRAADAAERGEAHARTAEDNSAQVLAMLQAQGTELALLGRVPPPPHKSVPRPALKQSLVDALRSGGRAGVTGAADHQAAPGARAAAQGDGGQGKSVLALTYARDHAASYPGGCFRVIVENESLEAALAAMIPPLPALQGLSQLDKARLAQARLSRPPRCLLIIDNVDRLSDWLDPAFQALVPTGDCDVIVTSREPALPNITLVPVGRLTLDEARRVLAAFRPSAAQHDAAVQRLVRALEGLAVAVASVGAMMAIAEDDDWSAYAAHLEAIPLHEFPDADARTQAHLGGYTTRVFAALDDLYERLPPPARRAMEYAALLPEDSIPAIDHRNGHPPGVAPADWLAFLIAHDADAARGAEALNLGVRPTGRAWTPADFVRKLQELELLTPATDDRTLWSLHRLHARRCKERFAQRPAAEREARREAIARCVDSRRAVIIGLEKDGSRRDVARAEILTHAELRWELTPLQRAVLESCAAGLGLRMFDAAGWVSAALIHRASLHDARAVLEQALGFLGDSPLHTATLSSNLAIVLQRLGDYSSARKRIETVIAIDEQYLPPDHPALAIRYTNLATILQDLGEYAAARERMEAAIAIEEKHFAPDHPTLATSYSNLASILMDLGEHGTARGWIEAAIVIDQKYFASDHPTLATRYSTLAMILNRLGKFTSARTQMDAAIAIEEKHFPSDHLRLAVSYSNLAVILKNLGDYSAARERMQAAIAIEEKHFPPDHPTLAIRYNNLALIELALGNRDAACAGLRRALAIRRKHFRDDHPRIRSVLESMRHSGCGE